MFKFLNLISSPLSIGQEFDWIFRIFRNTKYIIQKPGDEEPDSYDIRMALFTLADYGICEVLNSPYKSHVFYLDINSSPLNVMFREPVEKFTEEDLLRRIAELNLALYAKEFYAEAVKNNFKVFSFTLLNSKGDSGSICVGPYQVEELKTIAEVAQIVIERNEEDFIIMLLPGNREPDFEDIKKSAHTEFLRFCRCGLGKLTQFSPMYREGGYSILIQKDLDENGNCETYGFDFEALTFKKL